jgi:Ca-activated chloride channel homolog
MTENHEKDTALEIELAALQPHSPSPQLRERLATEVGSATPRRLRWSRRMIAVGAGLAAACVLGAIFVPKVHEARQRQEVLNNIKQMGVSAHSYNDQYSKLPPALGAVQGGMPGSTAYASVTASLAPVERNASILTQSPDYSWSAQGIQVGLADGAARNISPSGKAEPTDRKVVATGIAAGYYKYGEAAAANAPDAAAIRDRNRAVAFVLKNTSGELRGKTEPTTDPNRDSVEEYNRREDHPFLLAQREPLSTFSINVDSASYSNVRRMLLEGRLPPKDAVRIEEFVNYFSYQLPQPEGNDPIAISAEVAACPWQPEHRLVRVGLQGKRLNEEELPPRNFVFLVDTSGSMNAPNRLPLLQQSLLLLARKLRAQDRVAIVAYAGSAGLVLPPTRGDDYDAIYTAIQRLQAGGSTNGGAGIQLAYQTAREAFIDGGLNRVILGTDGDFNVGVTGAELVRLVENQRDSGIYLTLLGFGMGNLKDGTMEQLSRHGNGQYAYIDTLAEARRLFVEQIAGLTTIAKDVKVQIEFNPRQVQGYRLLGYESRMLQHHDFNDDKKDAGEMGAGHSVIALYEVVPPGVKLDVPATDPLKYQQPSQPNTPSADELMTVKVRYIPPDQQTSRLLSHAVNANKRPFAEASSDFRFAAAVASVALLLRDAPHKGGTTYADVFAWAKDAVMPDAQGYREEFLRLVRAAERLSPR